MQNRGIAYLLFGNMCAGKTTVGQILGRALGYEVIAAKDLVARNLAKADDEVKALRAGGYLLPDALILSWLFEEVEVALGAGRRVILDGVPRTAGQAQAILERYPDRPAVIDLDFPLDVIRRRFDNRLLCDGCQMPFSKLFEDFAHVCPYCGGRAFRPRPTDRPDYLAVKTRQFEAVSKQVLPVLREAGLTRLTVADHGAFATLKAEAEALAGKE